MPDEKLVLLDMDYEHWTVKEARTYRTAVGVNPEYAVGALVRAGQESDAETAAFGEAGPPEGYLPLPLLNIDPGYLLGFAWMAARRESPVLTFDAYAEDIETGELMRAFIEMLTERVEEASPLEEPQAAKPRKTSSPSKSPSASASSTAGD
jgi:hypothetical protein